MRALKLKRRPPFTTFAHRLMNTTFSVVSPLAAELLSVWRSCRRPPEFGAAIVLKFKSTFASRVRESFHFAVINVTATIENHVLNLFGKQSLGDCLADHFR